MRTRPRRTRTRAGLALSLLVAGALAGLVAGTGASGPPTLGPPSLRLATAAADASSTGPTTTPGDESGTSTTTTTLPPAPAGFTQSVTGLYSDMYATVEATGIAAAEGPGSPLIPSADQFDQLIDQLSPSDLALLYNSTSNDPGWTTLPSTYQQLTAEAQAQPIQDIPTVSVPAADTPIGAAGSGNTGNTGTGSTGSTGNTGTTGSTSNARSSARSGSSSTGSGSAPSAEQSSAKAATASSSDPAPFPPAEPTGSFPNPPAPYQASPLPVAPTVVPACPSPAPGDDWGDTAVFATGLAADIIDDLEPTLPDMYLLEVSPPPVAVDVTVPDPVLVALAVLGGAAHVISDTFAFLHNYWADCLIANTAAYLANIDNTTANIYDLATLMETTLNNVESSVDTVSAQVSVVQQTEDDQLVLNLQQALTAPADSPPNAAYEEPASVGGNLNSQPIGVQELVTQDLAEAQAAGIAVNPAANQDLMAGNVALANGNDKEAYADFHASYLEVAQ